MLQICRYRPGRPTGPTDRFSAASERPQKAMREPTANLHELLKRMAFEGSPQSDNQFQRSRPGVGEVAGVSEHYFLLDSFVKDPAASDLAHGVFAWNLMVEGVAAADRLGSRHPLETVTEMDMGQYSFPAINEVPYVLRPTPAVTPSGRNQLTLVQNNTTVGAPYAPLLAPNVILFGTLPYGQYPYQLLPPPAGEFRYPWLNNPYSQTPNGNAVTVQVGEAGDQAYVDHAPAQGTNARHHFEYVVGYFNLIGATNPNFLQAVPAANAGPFIFTDPIKSMESITLTFRSPDRPIRFVPDVYYGVSLSLGPGPTLYVQFDVVDHQLNEGDRIYVTGCACGYAPLDEFINSDAGLCVNGDPVAAVYAGPMQPIATPDTFWTDPAVGIANVTTATPVFPQRVNVYVLRRRLLIPFRVRGVVPKLTNYKLQ
jgi:hypothetical protein